MIFTPSSPHCHNYARLTHWLIITCRRVSMFITMLATVTTLNSITDCSLAFTPPPPPPPPLPSQGNSSTLSQTYSYLRSRITPDGKSMQAWWPSFVWNELSFRYSQPGITTRGEWNTDTMWSPTDLSPLLGSTPGGGSLLSTCNSSSPNIPLSCKQSDSRYFSHGFRSTLCEEKRRQADQSWKCKTLCIQFYSYFFGGRSGVTKY